MPNVAPPQGMTRAESKELNRRRLLEAAREELIRCGYGALSARQVSARAGVAQSSFYAHFRDKEDLVRTLADEIFGRLRARLRLRQANAASSWDEMIERTLLNLYDFFLGERALVALLLQELDQPASPVGEIGREIFDTLHADFEQDMLELIGEGQVPALPVKATVVTLIGASTWMLRLLLQGKLEDATAVIDDMVEMQRAMLRGWAQTPVQATASATRG